MWASDIGTFGIRFSASRSLTSTYSSGVPERTILCTISFSLRMYASESAIPVVGPIVPWPGTIFSTGAAASRGSAFAQDSASASGRCRSGRRPFNARSPAKSTFSAGRSTTRSPVVWAGPSHWISARRSPSNRINLSETVIKVGEMPRFPESGSAGSFDGWVM